MGNLNRELRIMRSTLKVGLKRDVSDTSVGKQLQSKGFVTKGGKTSAKGKKALKLF